MYGSEKVLPYNQKEHKGVQVRRMFDAIAGKYDVLNHTLSFGFDKGWRRRGIRFLRPFAPSTEQFFTEPRKASYRVHICEI